MQMTANASSSIFWVSAWLRLCEMSIPTFFSAITEFSETGSPARAATPAEITFSERSGSGCASSACCNSAAAMGLRHIFAVQTVTIVSEADTGRERTCFSVKRKARFRTVTGVADPPSQRFVTSNRAGHARPPCLKGRGYGYLARHVAAPLEARRLRCGITDDPRPENP